MRVVPGGTCSDENSDLRRTCAVSVKYEEQAA